MAITQDELQSIISAVLSSIRTNSKTIDQLTPVTSLSETDCFEINGGKKVTYKVLRDLIASLSSSDQDSLRTLINKCELKSASITTAESTATLSISSVGKTITTSIPIATTSKAGLMTAADKLKLQSAYDTAQTAKDTANTAKSKAEAAQSGINTLSNKIGVSNGIAPLDANAKVPAANLPGFVDDVIEFNAMVSGVTTQLASSIHKSTDAGCMVVYDTDRNTFLLAVAKTAISADHVAEWETIKRPIKAANIPSPAIVNGAITSINVGEYWTIDNDRATLISGMFTYYNNWSDADSFGVGSISGRIPEGGKVYICTSDNKTFRWSGSELVAIGSDLALGHTANTAFPGDEGAQLQEDLSNTRDEVNAVYQRVNDVSILPFDGFYEDSPDQSAGVWFRRYPSDEGGQDCMWSKEYPNGYSSLDYNTSFHGFLTIRHDKIFRLGNDLYRYDGENLVKVGGASVGNVYNLTAELPTPDPERIFYTLNDTTDKYYAPAAVLAQNKAKLGMDITFAIAKGSWKSYKYVGLTLDPNEILNKDNWLDLAGMSAGSEPFVNINAICDDKDYTLSLAIQALLDLKESTGIDYRKEGMVITYRRSSNPFVWETKQYQGALSDLTATNEEQWHDFGNGGGGKVETKDEPEKDGKDALSTGGAYEMQQNQFAGLEIVPDPTNYVIQGVSKAGNAIGDSISIPKSNGAGTAAGSTLTIYCDQAVWGAFGSEVSLMVAIKSVSYDGEDEVLGTIRTVSIIDPVTGIELWSEVKNESSSTSASDTKFKFDFTDFITSASSRDFIIQAIDADGNRRTRTITVTAVDVTCTCIQTLNYSNSTALEVGGREKSLPMYKFENNVSTKHGILVTTEMFYNGQWRVLGTATVTDSYSHNISINPTNVFGGGEQLGHGSYPIRIKGKDIASGVVGNTVYTAVMCVDSANTTPIVSLRYDDRSNGKVRLYDSISVDVAAYTPGKTRTAVEVIIDGHIATSVNCETGQTLNVSKQIQGYASDGSKSFDVYARSGASKSETITLTVEGSAIDAEVKEGALFSYDFSTRSNTETDHTISDNGYEMAVNGCNFNSNGFVNVLGETVLRIAENVTAEIPYAPFASSALETAGAAIQLAFSTKSIKDKDALLCECYDPTAGVGLRIRGNEVVLSVLNGTPKQQRVGFKCGEKITVAVVVEPGSKYVSYKGTNYSFVKLYVNGEECAAIGYQPGTSALRQNKTITFNSANGDFNLNYFMAYSSYMEWLQAFRNYLCKLSDVSAMIAEYDKENVLDTTGKPSMSLMAAKGIPYYVIVADQTTFNNYDYALNGGTNTGDQFACTLYYFNPEHPEVNFKAVNVLWRRQGTTSAQRPIKNDRFNFNKKNKTTGLKATVTLLNPDDSTELGRNAIKAAADRKVFCSETGNFIDVVTVKVDYSDSSNANDCGVCDLMNATFRSLGSTYMTPAQRAFDGRQILSTGDVITGRQMDHSTKNHPVACFRATTDTLQDAWFHAKGNWKEDKGEQTALGFKDTPGYNLGCLNYGDFVEYFGTPGETLAQTEARFKADPETNTEDARKNVYLISQYCGRDYAIYRYKNGAWTRSTGSMKQVNGKWQVTGDVLNPVSGYELLQYAGMDWWQGVGSVEDMMAPTTQKSSWVNKLGLAATTYPAWTYYFECMIDDDQLQEDLALGKKVPYDLFNMLRFFDSCDYSKVSGWEKIWKENAYRYMSLESAMAYTAFTDYLAAVDQRAKNMQPMFFLEDGCSVENGVYSGYKNMEPTRMYLNKVYDCDTCNGADNDGGRDIDAEVDPNKMTDEASGYTNPYMGYGSVLFNNLDRQQECWNSNDLGVTTISLKSVVNRMRNQTAEIDGKTMVPFSPDGALYFFVQSKLMFWPKVISSYDGERKYIDNTSIANQPYFYALHGLGLTSLPRFIEARWAIRDGYYQTGDFFTNPLSGRVSAISPNSKIYITAAATGYFGIGNDASGQLSEVVFLEAGQSHAFTTFAHDAGALLYIYQPGRMSRIDLSEMSLAFHFDDLSKLELAEEIILGGNKHSANTPLNGFNALGSIVLGELPFLRNIDISLTTATSVDASGCPRVESIIANDTNLTTCNLAQTSPIETLTLPGTMTSLELVNLPNLSFPGGLTLASVANINRLWVEGSKFIDTEKLLLDIAKAGAIREVRIPDVNVTASVTVLRMLRDSGAIGLDSSGSAYEESNQCSGVIGRWILTELIKDNTVDGLAGLTELNRYFPELDVINSQYSHICFSDFENDTANITNVDDSTGYKFGTPYTVPGHWAKVEELSHAFKATFNSRDGKMYLRQISDADYGKMRDGSDYDPADLAGEGFDIMKLIHPHWRKGVNDFKNQEKHTFISSCVNEPISTATRINRKKLGDILVKALSAIFTDNVFAGSDYEITDNPNMNVYELNVEGMRQVRWPGVNNALIGAVFLDSEGKVISKYNMSVGAALFDFVNGEYIYTDVPNGAVKFVFTAPVGFDDQEAIAVDSSAVEAIEPDWVYVGGSLDNSAIRELVGVYGMSLDSLMRARSISGAVTKRGENNNTINPDWQYDSDGNLTNATVPTSTMTGSAANLINLCRMRGPGFYSIDYEMRIDIDNLVMGIIGDRDVQAVCGYGCSSGYTTGANGMNAYGNVTRRWNGGNTGNIIFGIQNYVGCNSEWQDNVAVNVTSFVEMRRQKYSEASTFPIDAKWHIHNPLTKKERVVQGITDANGVCVARVKHGRYCDMIASRCTTDTSKYNQNYSGGHWYSAGRSRVPLRSGNNAGASGGLAYSNAYSAGTGSFTSFGVRLAFRGECVFVDDAA